MFQTNNFFDSIKYLFWVKNVFRIGSEWFALARIQISELIGIFLIGSEWIPIRYFRQGSIEASLQDFTLNSVFRKLWFSVFIATNVWIKSKAGHWNFYHLFFFILSIFLSMESTLAIKMTTTFFFYILGYYLFFYFIWNVFFSHVTLFSISKKLLHILRNKIKQNHDNCLEKKKVIQS